MRAVYLFLFTLLLAACAGTATERPNPGELAVKHGYQLEKEVKEIRQYRINGWNYVSDRALIINGGPSRKYLLILNRRCPYLRSEEIIGYSTTATSVLARFDAVIVKDSASGITEKCHIDRIFEVTRADREGDE